MDIIMSDDCVGVLPDHGLSKQYTVYGYQDGAISFIPHDFFRNWEDEEPQSGSFQLGRCSGIGVGSIAKYDNFSRLIVGKYVSGGSRLRFVLASRHEMRSISTSGFSVWSNGLLAHPVWPTDGDTFIHNDIWIGDEVLILGGSVIESGCVIGARAVITSNFRSEPYGIYAGVPARLIRFRFPEKVREKLVELSWWDMPFFWIKANNAAFLVNLEADEGHALELLEELQRSKNSLLSKHSVK